MRGMGSIAAVVMALLLAYPHDHARAQNDSFQEAFGKLFSGIGDEFNRIAKGTTRKTVNVRRKYKPGEIIVSTKDRKLYYVIAPGAPIATRSASAAKGFSGAASAVCPVKPNGRIGVRPRKCSSASRSCPSSCQAVPDNPLGARALYLGSSLYRIHGHPCQPHHRSGDVERLYPHAQR